jgi:integrase/recombinase XerD
MLSDAVKMYLAGRRAAGFVLKCEGFQLKSFAAFSEARGRQHVSSDLAIEWAGSVRSMAQRARRLGTIIRFARYMRAEDPRHQVPAPIFGAEKLPRRAPFILTMDQIRQIIDTAAHAGYRTLRRATYSTLFALLACTGLRVSEAIRLRFDDITADGLVIRRTKFRKSRLVPLHPTARAGLERYLRQRRPYAPFDDHVFVSIRRKPLLPADVDTAFQTAVKRIGLPHGRGRVRPTPHSLRHAFAVRALQTCPDGRDAISRHMVALSTYLGHSQIANTYWYLEAVPDLMRDIADQSERIGTRGRS